MMIGNRVSFPTQSGDSKVTGRWSRDAGGCCHNRAKPCAKVLLDKAVGAPCEDFDFRSMPPAQSLVLLDSALLARDKRRRGHRAHPV